MRKLALIILAIAGAAILATVAREPIELPYHGGLTQSELAARLDLPPGTIKSRMFAGLQRLRALLVESGYEPD